MDQAGSLPSSAANSQSHAQSQANAQSYAQSLAQLSALGGGRGGGTGAQGTGASAVKGKKKAGARQEQGGPHLSLAAVTPVCV